MAGRGGARPGAGRPKGSREAATKEHLATISELARAHAPAALQALVQIAQSGESESARVAASTAILDRAYGKPGQSVTVAGDPDNPMVNRIVIEAATVDDSEDQTPA